MAADKQDDERTPVPGKEPGQNDFGSTLLPMLIAGLVLIVVGAVIVMTFV